MLVFNSLYQLAICCTVTSMRLVRYGDIGEERPGVLLSNGDLMDVHCFVRDYDREFFESGGVDSLKQWFVSGATGSFKIGGAPRLAPPVEFANSRLHHVSNEGGCDLVVRSREVEAYGAYDSVTPRSWSECRLESVSIACVVISPKHENFHLESHLAGCMAMLCFQFDSGDLCCGCGSELLTMDELGEHPLSQRVARYWARLNHHTSSLGWYSDIKLCMPTIIEEVLSSHDVRAGDVIALTNTLCGDRGLANTVELHKGDLIECEVEGLGGVRHRFVAA